MLHHNRNHGSDTFRRTYNVRPMRMKKAVFFRLNMLLNLQLEASEAKAYAQYVEECRKLAIKMHNEFEKTGVVTPELITQTQVKTPYPIFYENKAILPYLDLERKDEVIGIKVRHLTLYKNSLKSHYKDIKKRLNDLSEHFGFPLECPSNIDMELFIAERQNINATAQLLRQYGIDFTPIESYYWCQNTSSGYSSKYTERSSKEQAATFTTGKIIAQTRLRPLIGAEHTTPRK